MSQNPTSFVETKTKQRKPEQKRQEENKLSETTSSKDEQSYDVPPLSIEEQLECFADLLIDELLKHAL